MLSCGGKHYESSFRWDKETNNIWRWRVLIVKSTPDSLADETPVALPHCTKGADVVTHRNSKTGNE